jgi:hypothetical protein
LTALAAADFMIAVLEEIGDVSQWLGDPKAKTQKDKARASDVESAVQSGELPELRQHIVNGVPKPVFF